MLSTIEARADLIVLKEVGSQNENPLNLIASEWGYNKRETESLQEGFTSQLAGFQAKYVNVNPGGSRFEAVAFPLHCAGITNIGTNQ